MTPRAASREFRSPAVPAAPLWLAALGALALHGGIYFCWPALEKRRALIEIEGDSVEVALVETSPVEPAPEPAAPGPEQPMPEPRPEPTKPEPIQEPPRPERLPEPPKPGEFTQPALPQPVPKTARAKPRVPSPSRPMPAARAGAPVAPNGKQTGVRGGKPRFAVRPQASYPAESRATGEHGTVVLRITLGASGRPTAVKVSRSSGFPRLDRAAVEGGWRCRVVDAEAGTSFEHPVRFNLQ